MKIFVSATVLAVTTILLSPPICLAAEEKPRKKNNKSKESVEVTLESTITGNREQPKVLYIVPWQAPDGPESLRQGLQSDLDELFRPVERDEFLRQLKHKTGPQKAASSESK